MNTRLRSSLQLLLDTYSGKICSLYNIEANMQSLGVGTYSLKGWSKGNRD